MEFDKVIRKRTATRSFKSDEVSDSKIRKYWKQEECHQLLRINNHN